MLFILTGDVQIGKTRFLEDLVAQMRKQEIACYGVLAPGVWVDHGPQVQKRYEKIGIDNLMLPQGERVPFARRRDLKATDVADTTSTLQSDSAQLAWAIDDRAIVEVNRHFDDLTNLVDGSNGGSEKGLLLIDEFGRLELLHDKGLTSAMKLLKRGATSLWPHAILVVREYLLDRSIELFGEAWGDHRIMAPDENFIEEIQSRY